MIVLTRRLKLMEWMDETAFRLVGIYRAVHDRAGGFSMTARLFIREVGQREFVQHNGEFDDITAAANQGEKLCTEGNVEAFQVWDLALAKVRVWDLKDITA